MQVIYKLRKQRNWSQAELAEKVGVCPAFISHVEAGRKEPRVATLRKLAEVFGVSTDYLLKGGVNNADQTYSQTAEH